MEGRAVDRSTIVEDLQRAADEVLGEDAPTIDERLALGDDAEIDSLDLIEISMVIEERYSIAFEPSDLDGVTSIGDVVDVILGKVAAAGG